MGTTAAVVLAAGGGRRFEGEGHKLLAPFRGSTVVTQAVQAAVDAGLDEVVVVVGAIDVRAVLPAGVTVVDNPRWAEGQATSLQVARQAVAAAGHDAMVVGLGDQPLIEPAAWAAVAASTSPIAVATYDGQRRNPVRLAEEVWPLLPSEGDEGARSLIRGRSDLVEAVPCPGTPVDIDTQEDLRRWS
ncbi:nucleotidyltransferase family protein [Actinomarinicola tropica]|uniref:NTP transferase domain-containing protein n=1 Tax=Actinomarinicola tropica TaxID=2789776 RepID=A0A5Q2RM08_9ACTN|nr:NTP transferase domain-containing protein [Actinomarinicola tropica]QGG95972.1 NTP transferase domain-containing protein [Actinomarinicola tropica]